MEVSRQPVSLGFGLPVRVDAYTYTWYRGIAFGFSQTGVLDHGFGRVHARKCKLTDRLGSLEAYIYHIYT